MTLGLKFPEGFGDESVPSIGSLQVSVQPGPFDPQPQVSEMPPEPEPQVSVMPQPFDPSQLCNPPPGDAPQPMSRMPPPGLRVDLSKIPDTSPTIDPTPNPFTGLFDHFP
jgi:hypothetical protein